MHLKRNIEAPVSLAYLVTPPPSPSTSVIESFPPTPSPPKSSLEKINPFTNIQIENSKKLAALEASGASGYVLVASPTVNVTKTISIIFYFHGIWCLNW